MKIKLVFKSNINDQAKTVLAAVFCSYSKLFLKLQLNFSFLVFSYMHVDDVVLSWVSVNGKLRLRLCMMLGLTRTHAALQQILHVQPQSAQKRSKLYVAVRRANLPILGTDGPRSKWGRDANLMLLHRVGELLGSRAFLSKH